MQSRHFPLERVILIFGCVGTVCWGVGMMTGIRVIEGVGAAMVGILVIPAMVLAPIMLTMRLFGIGQQTTSLPSPNDDNQKRQELGPQGNGAAREEKGDAANTVRQDD